MKKEIENNPYHFKEDTMENNLHSFEEYIEKRLTKGEIEEISEQAEKEVKEMKEEKDGK